jgi:TRAP-type mannitol/chloroaromatic compound transport system substrate-binding protein
MMGSFHQASECFEIVFNKKKFDALPADLRAILRTGVEAVNSANFWLAMENYSSDLQILKNKHKVNVIKTPRSIMVEQLKAWDKLKAELSKDPINKKIIDAQRAWYQRVVYYAEYNTADYRLAFETVYKTKIA